MSDAIAQRKDVDARYLWDLSPLYDGQAGWEREFAQVEQAIEPVLQLRGKLNRVRAVKALFSRETELNRILEKLYVYAHLREDEDTRDSATQRNMARIRAKCSEVQSQLAWVQPEILANPESRLKQFLTSRELQPFRYPLEQIIRRKAHTLSEKEETLLSRTAEVLSAPKHIFSYLTNADLRFPPVKDAEGAEREMSDGRYALYLQDPVRQVRQAAFSSMYEAYGSVKNTLAATLSATVKLHNISASVREHPSALHSALFGDQVPTALYETLIATTRAGLPHYFDYLELRRRQLGLEQLDMYDLYVPIVPGVDERIPYEQARDWVLAACEPLGDAYGEVLHSAFDQGWIDVYENRGKRSGAYSSGCYDSLPYVLMNYQGTLNDVFTLAHELGHSMHTWLANKNQPPQTSHYPIFIAEIASTLNEDLLLRHLLGVFQNDERKQAYLLNHCCDSFKGTVYRQTMFAEFEKRIHEQDAQGEPLTHESLGSLYDRINRDYFGPRMDPDPRIALEWARIPHFYYCFYVYKYATSYCASQLFARRILESAAMRDAYLGLLGAGGSAPPLDLIRQAGVDLTDPATLAGAFDIFKKALDDLTMLLEG